MIKKSCHTCEYGGYENQEEVDRAMRLTCGKMTGAKTDGEIVDPKRYVCGLWRQVAMDSGR
jgi:hypothetical protein